MTIEQIGLAVLAILAAIATALLIWAFCSEEAREDRDQSDTET